MCALLLTEEPMQTSIFDLTSETIAAPRAPQAVPVGGFPAATATGDRLTLDDVLVGAWEGLSASHTVACPACGGAMTPRRSAGAAGVLTVTGGCDCGAVLA